VTGGSSGIGLSIAKIALKYGANVSILARDRKKLDECSKLLEPYRINEEQQILTFSVDVSDYLKVETVVKEAETKLGIVYILVNCAGYCYSDVFEEIPLEHFTVSDF
jgi:3-dehydrosphinganine reductase